MNYDKAASYWTEKDKESVKMNPDVLKQKITDFICKHKPMDDLTDRTPQYSPSYPGLSN